MKFSIKAGCILLLLGCAATGPVNPNQGIYENEIAWESKVPEKLAGNQAFDFVHADDDLPNVLIMGNSISIGYTPTVRESLAGVANVYRIPDNGGDTRKALKNMELWLGNIDWDVIHFNWGLHDLKRLVEGKLNIKGDRLVPSDEYKANLEQIMKRLLTTDATLIWATTSFVPDGAAGRIRGEEEIYNAAANEVLAWYSNILIDDQFLLTSSHPDEQRVENVHFKTEGKKRQGTAVADMIRQALNKQPGLTRNPIDKR